MLTEIIAVISAFILKIISRIGYGGIFVLMAIDSFNIPIPSEISMPFGGFLSGQGKMSFWLIVLAGTLGSLVGSWLSYGLAMWLKEPLEKFLTRFKWSRLEYEKAHNFFTRHGKSLFFLGACCR